MTDSLAVYIHFPFCISICPYCDFDRQATGFDRTDVYLDSVVAEIEAQAKLGATAHSIFFGGGTPSLMTAPQVKRILDAIRANFDVLPDAEITLEGNPGDADLSKMHGFREAGVNRISLGIQSLDDEYLTLLGRRHSAAEARQAAAWAMEAGFRLNMDFMFGLPKQTLEHWSQTLDEAIAVGPDHFSCYLLTVDEKVQMGRDVERGKLVLPEDEDLSEMYHLTRSKLAAAGYEQYEISNWAKPGETSLHNFTYWRDGQWIGVGAGAASSYGGRRWKNAPALERYIRTMAKDGVAARVEDETLDAETAALDTLTLGLRLREGLDVAAFERRHGFGVMAALGDEAVGLIEAGVLALRGERLTIRAEHQLITNEVIVRLSEPLERAAQARMAVSV